MEPHDFRYEILSWAVDDWFQLWEILRAVDAAKLLDQEKGLKPEQQVASMLTMMALEGTIEVGVRSGLDTPQVVEPEEYAQLFAKAENWSPPGPAPSPYVCITATEAGRKLYREIDQELLRRRAEGSEPS